MTNFLVGVVLSLWLLAVFLAINARNFTRNYEGRHQMYWVSFFLMLAGVWIAVYIPSYP